MSYPPDMVPQPEVTFSGYEGHVASPWDIPVRGIHCDPLVLHSPGVCFFCDEHGSDLQAIRAEKLIAFTDDIGYVHLPCPARAARGDACQEWGGITGFGGNKPAGTREQYEANWAEWFTAFYGEEM